jgi:hypothetical protein
MSAGRRARLRRREPELAKQPVSVEVKQQLQNSFGAPRVGGRDVRLEDAKLPGD